MKTTRILTLTALLAALTAANAVAKPLKIYIMSGQSNMQGKASPATFPAMAEDPESKDLYEKIVDEDGNARVLSNVCVAAESTRWGKKTNKSGPLTTGYGSMLYNDDEVFGTELAFGITLYEHLQEPILIIKASWGGKDLNTDFRPPSAGPFYPDFSKMKDQDGNKGEMPDAGKIARKKKETRVYYNLMMDFVKTVLDDPSEYCSEYNPKDGYELAGFVWFQGYNDIIKTNYYKEPEGTNPYAKYTTLMAQFIRDVRKDLKAPEMPFVIGVMGLGGITDGDFQKAQAAPAMMPEFKGNVVAVLTGAYWDEKLGDLDTRLVDKVLKPFNREKRGLEKDEQRKLKDKMMAENFTEKELQYLEAGRSNAGFHYLGSAKIYSRIGEAFANALLEMKSN